MQEMFQSAIIDALVISIALPLAIILWRIVARFLVTHPKISLENFIVYDGTDYCIKLVNKKKIASVKISYRIDAIILNADDEKSGYSLMNGQLIYENQNSVKINGRLFDSEGVLRVIPRKKKKACNNIALLKLPEAPRTDLNLMQNNRSAHLYTFIATSPFGHEKIVQKIFRKKDIKNGSYNQKGEFVETKQDESSGR